MNLKPFLFLLVAMLIACTGHCAGPNDYSLGVEAYRNKDFAAARGHWTKSMEQGDLNAYSNLGFLLNQGLGGEVDLKRALVLWQKAAKNGHSEAQSHLAYAYLTGNGVRVNLVHAYAWYRCAVVSARVGAKTTDGSERQAETAIGQTASKGLETVANKLSPEQLAAAERLAKQTIEAYAKAER